MGRPGLTVVGSVNLDLVVTCSNLPEPGETLIGAALRRSPGGKGANQALAARRLGADVTMVAGVGPDQEAQDALSLLTRDGVDLTSLKVVSQQPTGIALITVAGDGENTIVVVPGANGALTPADVPALATDGTLCQLEVPLEVVARAAERAQGLFCVNAAPAPADLPEQIVRRADVVIVNEVEHRALAERLAGVGGLVVITRGAAGAVVLSGGEQIATAAPPPVRAIDAVGAGDAFAAAFTVALLEAQSVTDAVRFACAAGALATTKHGAQDALPTRPEVEDVLTAAPPRGGAR